MKLNLRSAMIGATVLLAACGSSTPTAPTTVFPSLAGRWAGTFTITGCSDTGAATAAGFCQNLFSSGSLVYAPTQTSGNLGGTLTIEGAAIPVTGTVGTDNVVALTGTLVEQGGTFTVTNFRGTLSGNSLPGTMAFNIVAPSSVGGTATVMASFTLQR